MKYYSEILKTTFDTPEACEAEEEKYLSEQAEKEAEAKKLSEERKIRAKEVEEAFKAASEAKKHADELLKKFTEDYNSFHFSIRSTDNVSNIFDWLWNSFIL